MDLSTHPLANASATQVRTVSKAWEDDANWISVSDGSVATTLGASAAGLRARKAFTRTLTPEEIFAISPLAVSCVRAYTNNIPLAKQRFFTASGEEIVGGDVVDFWKMPYPGISYTRWIERQVVSMLVRGEMAAKKFVDNGRLVKMAPIWPHPQLLTIKSPTSNPRFRSDVVTWQYVWADGQAEDIPDAQLLFDTDINVQPFSIRGLSRFEVAAIVATAQHQSEVYEASFFANGATPSGVLNIGENVGRADLADFDRKWHSKFGGAENAHKLAIASGKGLAFVPIEQAFQDGAFIDMQRRIDEQIQQVLNVPPIMAGGVLQESRFKTAPEEKLQFADSALIPMMNRMSELHQVQVIDAHFRGTKITRRRPRGKQPNTDSEGNKYFSKAMGESFEKARSERPDASIIILYDPDTLPIIPETKLANAEHRLAFRETYNLSPEQLAKHFGDDLPDPDDQSPARTHVWVKNDKIDITDLKANEQIVPGLRPQEPKPAAPAVVAAPPKKPTKKTLDPAERLRLDKAYAILRKLRRLTIDKLMGDGELWGLSDGDSLNTEDDRAVWKEIRRVRFELAEARKASAGDREKLLSAAKAIFNNIDKTHLHKALNL